MKKILTILFLFFYSLSYAQNFYDINTIQSIEVYMSQSNWDYQMDNAYSSTGDYIMADSVVINGTSFDSVGVKYKGNSSYNSNQVKNPWHIELDTYKDQDYQGYKDIKLANGYNDPSFLRDVLAYDIVRNYMEAPEANYTNLYVNGTLIGLYSNTEAISKTFVKDRFGNKNNTFFSCSPPDGANPQGSDYPNLVYLLQDSTDYYDSYELKSDYGWQELIDLCDTLTNNISDIEQILDVDKVLWMLAFDNVIVNLDSYIGIFSQNYYLYRDDYGRFLPVVWDLNESFGIFSQTGTTTLSTTSSKQQMSHLLHLSDSDWPLVKKLLSVPIYKRMYLAHVKTMLEENFDNSSYYTTGQTLQSLISSSVQADNNKFFTYNNFNSNLTTDINSGPPGPMSTSTPGITSLMDTRSSYLLSQSDFTNTQPVITNISLSNTTPTIGQSVFVTATITNETAVYLKYRFAEYAPFTSIQMYDDGAHNDGAANDGVYGAEITNLQINTDYYLYADNSNIGKFSPERAAHEYYSFQCSTTTSSDVVINEFMADNETTITDQDGEFDDWIELYNNSNSDVSLNGYYLSDDATELDKWQFPDTTIAANGYLIVWADKDDNQTGLHADIKLSASGEAVVLSDPSLSIIDQVSFSAQKIDTTTGRYPNGTGSFTEMLPTFEAYNDNFVGVEEITEETININVYPNPTNGEINIISNKNISIISIYNISGKLVKEITPNDYKATVDLSNLSKGILFVRIITEDNNIETKKIVLN